jgi:hypothetical protein
MSRFFVAAMVSLVLCPAAVACGMYVPDDTVLLTELLNEIDGVEEAVLEAPGLEDTFVIAEVLAGDDAVAQVTPAPAAEPQVEVASDRFRRAKRVRRRSKR